MTEDEIEKTYGKSIWKMTIQEIIQHNLESTWMKLVDENAIETED